MNVLCFLLEVAEWEGVSGQADSLLGSELMMGMFFGKEKGTDQGRQVM